MDFRTVVDDHIAKWCSKATEQQSAMAFGRAVLMRDREGKESPPNGSASAFVSNLIGGQRIPSLRLYLALEYELGLSSDEASELRNCYRMLGPAGSEAEWLFWEARLRLGEQELRRRLAELLPSQTHGEDLSRTVPPQDGNPIDDEKRANAEVPFKQVMRVSQGITKTITRRQPEQLIRRERGET